MLPLAVAALLGVLEGAPAQRPTGPEAPGARAFEQLHSPFLEAREAGARALRGLGERGRAAVEEALRDQDFRVRAMAVSALAPVDRTTLERLVRVLAQDPSQVVRRAAGEALAAAGEPALEAFRAASTRIRPEDRRAFLLAYAVSGLLIVERENSSLGGGLKGHYDGQFERLSRWKDELCGALDEIVRRPDFPARMKDLALHALADAGPTLPASFVQRLGDLLPAYGLISRGRERPSDREDLEDDLLYCLARLGDDKPMRESLSKLEKQMVDEGARPETAFKLAYKWSRLREYDLAIRWYEEMLKLAERMPEQGGSYAGTAWYNLACIRSRRGEKTLALEALRRAFGAGYSDFSWVQQDRDLDPIRSLPEFQELLRSEMDRPRGR